MRWLITPLLWLLALAVALGVLWRLWRGKPVILRGKWTPRFLRMVAVVLVLLGIGADRTEAAPVPVGDRKGKVDEDLPPGITHDVVEKWGLLQARGSQWMLFKQGYSRALQSGEKPTPSEMERIELLARTLPERLRALLLADLRGQETGKPAARELIAVLDEAEKNGLLDPWLIAHVWRKTAGLDGTERKAVIDLMARLHRHARLANALIACQARIRPIMEPPVVWRSKAGRPREVNPEIKQALKLNQAVDLMRNLKAAYASADAGTWTKEALTLLTVESWAPVTFIRAGQPGMPQTEGNRWLGRLDLLDTTPGDRPAVLIHRTLGRIELPAGRLVSVWELPQFLPAKAKETLKKLVADSLAGKEDAARQLEKMLPIAHSSIREGLQTAPKAEGAPRLRLILTQFDDVPPLAPITVPLELYNVPDHQLLPRGRE